MRKLIASFEIISGVFFIFSVLLMVWSKVSESYLSLNTTATIQFQYGWAEGWVTLMGIAAYALLNLLGGIFLWRNKKIGFFISIIIQLLQLILVQMTSFLYFFSSIVGLILMASQTGLKATATFGFYSAISMQPQPVAETFVGINIVALAFLIALVMMLRRL
ncbi:MAG TPA: hypothetical protein VHZ76_02695 [Gammaproteobacteria bacterium]|jgi:hypothetical protein|nr:hypothetical protein [Gammaproteobacteria bacterium]